MIFVQSFWSKPAISKGQNTVNGREIGGWPSERYLVMSIAFSCLRCKSLGFPVSFITDEPGYKLLIGEIGLPYNNVETCLDSLAKMDERLWVLGKFKSFELQNKPFIHIDNDVYLWDFPKRLLDADLVCQSKISIPILYEQTLNTVISNFDFIPKCIQEHRSNGPIHVSNAGIIGGKNLDFYKEYCDIAKQFVERNTKFFDTVDLGLFNTILDELLFSCLARSKNLNIEHYFSDMQDDPFAEMVRFQVAPVGTKYVHLVGHAKRNILACHQLESRMKYEFPGFWRKCKDVADNLQTFNDVENSRQNQHSYNFRTFEIFYGLSMVEFIKSSIVLSGRYLLRRHFVNNCERLSLFDQENEDYVFLNEEEDILELFEEPNSINNICENYFNSNNYNEAERNEIQRRLVDIVCEKLMLENVLEFS